MVIIRIISSPEIQNSALSRNPSNINAKFYRRRPSGLGALRFEDVDTALTDGRTVPLERSLLQNHSMLQMTEYYILAVQFRTHSVGEEVNF